MAPMNAGDIWWQCNGCGIRLAPVTIRDRAVLNPPPCAVCGVRAVVEALGVAMVHAFAGTAARPHTEEDAHA
jgi:hypothetical protein